MKPSNTHYVQAEGCETARTGLTLIDLVVVIGLIAILIGIAAPAVMKTRLKALEMVGENNLRQLVLAVHQHEASNGKLPGQFRGECGPDAGWSFSIVYTLNDPVIGAFDISQPVENQENLRVGERFRPSVFETATVSETAIDVRALDDPTSVFKVKPTSSAFNGFLFHKKLSDLQTSNTAMFSRIKQAGPWLLSPEFFAIEPPTVNNPVLIGFADGSVRRRTSLVGVIIDP